MNTYCISICTLLSWLTRLQAVINGENYNELLQLLVHRDESSSKVTLVVETTCRVFKERFYILKSVQVSRPVRQVILVVETPKSVFTECSRIVNHEHLVYQ